MRSQAWQRDGTLVLLGVGPGEIKAAPMDLVGGRRRLMGSPSGSREDIRATLDFSAHQHVVPRITKVRLEDAGKMLEMMHAGKLHDRAVLMLRLVRARSAARRDIIADCRKL